MIDGPRGLRPYELDKLMEDVVNLVYNPRMRGAFPTLFCEENAENLRIIKVDGRIVSHIGVVVRDMIINGCRVSVGNVGAVCTHEDYRERGYAWSIFEDAMEKFRENGVDMFLISGFRNLYRLHGATHVGRMTRYSVRCDMELPDTYIESASKLAHSIAVRSFSPEDLPAWAALYRSEPVRFQRPYNDFEKLVTIMPGHRGKFLYSIHQAGQIAGYAVLVKSRDGIVYFDEYAGSRQALLESVRMLCEEFGTASVGIPVPAHDMEFSLLLDSVAAEVMRHNSTGGTIAILDFPRLCRKLKPMFEEIVGTETAQKLTFQERDGLCAIGLDNDKMVLDSIHDAARLIFGNPADRDERTGISAQGRLREVIEAIFPIPRPEYGLSFI